MAYLCIELEKTDNNIINWLSNSVDIIWNSI